MKIKNRALINDKEVDLVSNSSRLDLFSPGRGVFSVKNDQAISIGSKFDFISQISGQQPRTVMVGFVEQVTRIKNGFYKLFVRELSAALDRPLPINTRHLTAKQLLEKVADLTSLQFVVPNSPWVDNQNPRFQHIGSGYHLMDSILNAWGLEKGVWFCQSDGQIYLGELEKSLPGSKQIEMPSEWFSDLGVKGGTLPIIPRVRPGLTILNNGKKQIITSVQIDGETMRLNWHPNPWRMKRQIA